MLRCGLCRVLLGRDLNLVVSESLEGFRDGVRLASRLQRGLLDGDAGGEERRDSRVCKRQSRRFTEFHQRHVKF